MNWNDLTKQQRKIRPRSLNYLTQYRSERNSTSDSEGEQPILLCSAALICAVSASGSRASADPDDTLIARASCIWNSSSKKLKSTAEDSELLLIFKFSTDKASTAPTLGNGDGEADEWNCVVAGGWDGVSVADKRLLWSLKPPPMWSFRSRCFIFDMTWIVSHGKTSSCTQIFLLNLGKDALKGGILNLWYTCSSS